MRIQLTKAVHALTPPIVLSGAKRLYKMAIEKHLVREQGSERDAQWYDASFELADHWHRHYTESHYYFLWSVIVDHMRRDGVRSVLDIGCGVGQLACLIRDRGIPRYVGFDFSGKRIQAARAQCPEFEFHAEDAFHTQLFSKRDYDAVLCTEFLEHVERDLTVLRRIKPGTRFYGTVPNFPYTSHVRHFSNVTEVAQRYASCIRDLRVESFLADPHGKTFFLIEGVVAAPKGARCAIDASVAAV